MKKVRPFQHDEAGSDQTGFVAMALSGLCGWGPTREAAWAALVEGMRQHAPSTEASK